MYTNLEECFVLQPGAGGNGQQGVLPALFGFQLGPGETLAVPAQYIMSQQLAVDRHSCGNKCEIISLYIVLWCTIGQGYVEALTPEQQHQVGIVSVCLSSQRAQMYDMAICLFLHCPAFPSAAGN